MYVACLRRYSGSLFEPFSLPPSESFGPSVSDPLIPSRTTAKRLAPRAKQYQWNSPQRIPNTSSALLSSHLDLEWSHGIRTTTSYQYLPVPVKLHQRRLASSVLRTIRAYYALHRPLVFTSSPLATPPPIRFWQQIMARLSTTTTTTASTITTTTTTTWSHPPWRTAQTNLVELN
jgi:hypothetical protein